MAIAMLIAFIPVFNWMFKEALEQLSQKE